MIIIMRSDATKEQIDYVEKKIAELGFKTHPIIGDFKTVIGAIGNKNLLGNFSISSMPSSRAESS